MIKNYFKGKLLRLIRTAMQEDFCAIAAKAESIDQKLQMCLQEQQTLKQCINEQQEQVNRIPSSLDQSMEVALQKIDKQTEHWTWERYRRLEKHVNEIHRHIDFTYRDLMVALERQRTYLPKKNIRLVTDAPLAYESLDYLYPHGTIRDNTRYPRFVTKCEELLGRKENLAFLDLGCSGGGMVLEALLRGHISMGLEGSDSSLKEQRAEWRLLGDRLQTCDITKPFRLETEHGNLQLFNIITAWEVMEHIAESDLHQLFQNIQNHLDEDGYFIASIACWDDIDPKSGINWHVTLHPYVWWKKRFEEAGFMVCTELLQPIDLARGAYNPPHSYKTPSNRFDPKTSFHIVARKV
ncbi:class I SAM-dependent methyltransferase [Harryflintia acetispora]|uniref:methyltransferase domain-containing protein n=1 Tax=Harryflintia acetispora TaxID=1849041 RepID=UPI00189A3B0A|nr:class I SAM-dependent methyltransferase [Harryflintia acetispora]